MIDDECEGASVSLGACIGCRVRRAGFCSRLDADGLHALGRHVTQIDLPAGEVLWPDGATPHGATPGDAAIVVSGFLRRVHVGAGGRRSIVGLVMPGELAAPDLGERTGRLETATPARLCRFAPEVHDALCAGDPRFRRLAYAQARTELDRLRRLALVLGAFPPEDRVVSFLSMCARVMPWRPLGGGAEPASGRRPEDRAGGELTLQLSRADIAALLGISGDGVGRILRDLQDEGLIRIRDTRHFEIPDLRRLDARLGTADAGLLGPAQEEEGEEILAHHG